jgi:hypothetical protein
LQARVLRAEEHLLPMQAEERFGGIFSHCFVLPSVSAFLRHD